MIFCILFTKLHMIMHRHLGLLDSGDQPNLRFYGCHSFWKIGHRLGSFSFARILPDVLQVWLLSWVFYRKCFDILLSSWSCIISSDSNGLLLLITAQKMQFNIVKFLHTFGNLSIDFLLIWSSFWKVFMKYCVRSLSIMLVFRNDTS